MRTGAALPDGSNDLAAIVADPVRFARGLLRLDLWSGQEAILRSVARERRTAVKACHSAGKTLLAAVAVLWWITRHPDGIAITTAPTWTQVEKLLWGEIHKLAARSRVAYPTLNKTELTLGPGNFAMGLSTDQGVRFQGFHGRVLIVIDEAPGVRREIFEAVEGIRAGGHVRILALGNPTIVSGPFHDAFTANRVTWSTFTISAFATPNFMRLTLDDLLALSDRELDTAPWPSLVTRRWVREKYDEWGPAHPFWASRVLGEFPTQAPDALIALSWLETAARTPAVDTAGPVTAGLDVAGPGEDETALAITEGPNVLAVRAWSQADPRGELAAALAPYRERLTAVHVDAVGIGYYLAQHLDDLGLPVRLVNAGESPDEPDRFRNRKAELLWDLRQRFQVGAVVGLVDDVTIGQLAGLRYRHDARGRIEIESKDEARRRGVRSPDRAEALMLAFAGVPFEAPDRSRTKRPVERTLHPYDEQLRAEFTYLNDTANDADTARCRHCEHLDRGPGEWRQCLRRAMVVRPNEVACPEFDARI